MILMGDGKYLLLTEPYPQEDMQDIPLVISGNLGGARVWLSNMNAQKQEVPLSNLITGPGKYRLSSRDEREISIHVSKATADTVIVVRVKVLPVKSKLAPPRLHHKPDKLDPKCMQVYEPMYALVSYLYPFYVDDVVELELTGKIKNAGFGGVPKDTAELKMSGSFQSMTLYNPVRSFNFSYGNGGVGTNGGLDGFKFSGTLQSMVLNNPVKNTVTGDLVTGIKLSGSLQSMGLLRVVVRTTSEETSDTIKLSGSIIGMRLTQV